MKDISNNSWFLQYNSDITEEMFNKFISRFTTHKYYVFDFNFKNFKKEKYVRSWINEKNPQNQDYTQCCIDNNDQNNTIELFIDDVLLIISSNQNYEIY